METLLLTPALTLTDHVGHHPAPETVLRRIENLSFCITDSQGYFVEVNDNYLDLYGFSREELIGNHFTMVVPEEFRPLLAAQHAAFIAGDTELPTQYTVQHKDGTLMNIVVEALRVEDEDEGTSKLTVIDRA
jgi:PAS domain S-box-containing protein